MTPDFVLPMPGTEVRRFFCPTFSPRRESYPDHDRRRMSFMRHGKYFRAGVVLSSGMDGDLRARGRLFATPCVTRARSALSSDSP
ncbi:hypothetical protein F6X37_25970 [Paraburkholderia sp. 31.1]|nr:hypothetical protein [Paraburkholderia sp. 31.1]